VPAFVNNIFRKNFIFSKKLAKKRLVEKEKPLFP
jgi:hypothetical protein